jgi:hypothetical protein
VKLFDYRAAVLMLLAALAGALPAAAQTISNGDDGTTLKEIIIFGRHGSGTQNRFRMHQASRATELATC